MRRFLVIVILMASVAMAQGPSPVRVQLTPLGDGPWIIDTAEQHKIRVSVVTKGLSHPWSLAFLPNGNMLVTERSGKVRIIRNGVLDPAPVPGITPVHAVRLSGLMDIALHPSFAQNQFVYLTYTKDVEPAGQVSTTLVRGRFDGKSLLDMKDILVADAWAGNGGSGSRIIFDRDGMIYMSTGASNGNAAQELNNLRGKILRLRDDGTPAPGNPFAGREGAKPEIFSMGHRNTMGLAFHPTTGELWSSEMGPNGGDEINLIQPGKNYGWPLVSYGRTYEGPPVSEIPWREGMQGPVAFFVPGISPSGLAFYTGTALAGWKGNVFVGGMRVGQIPGTGHLVRIMLDENGNERRRETLLTELKQRIRDIKQGPDGFLYLLTEEDNAAVLKIEPAQ